MIPLAAGVTRVGRAADNDVRLGDSAVSRYHCRLVREGDDVRIFDVGSVNRTMVGGAPASGRVLRDGDILRLGRSRVAFRHAPATRSPAPPRKPPAPVASKKRERPAAPLAAAKRRAPRQPVAPAASRHAPGRVRQWRRRRSSLPIAIVAVVTALAAGGVWYALSGGGDDGVEVAVSVPDDQPIDASATPEPATAVNDAARPAAAGLDRDGAVTPVALQTFATAAAQLDADDDSPGDVAGETAPDNELAPAPARGDGVEADTIAETDSGAVTAVERVAVPLTAGDAREAYFASHIVPFLSKYCTPCHGEEEQKGDLALHEYRESEASAKDREVWEAVATKLRAGEMPPAKHRPRPGDSEVKSVIGWVDAAVFGKGTGAGSIDPGRVTMRRLNNYEYDATIRDLVGLDLRLAESFPADEIGYGFDNIGDILSIPPLLLEKYLAAAQKIVSGVWSDEAARARILICEPKRRSEMRSCARKILRAFATRAFRRPATSAEVSRLVKLVDLATKNDDGFDVGIQLALQAVLSSPYFLFRVELDSQPDNPKAIHPLNDFELASRLSYFLWASMPDEELFELTREGRLSNDDVLARQVERMIADEKSRGLVETFAALWLGSRQLRDVTPDPNTFPEFDDRLRDAMRRETELFFAEIMRKDLSVLNFISSDFTFLNRRLARHYGISGVEGEEVERVELGDDRRGGVLTQGTVLTVTSNPTRTSPVKRGRWVLEQILGTPPPPPPPGADSFAEGNPDSGPVGLREMMKRHRADPDCAVCHEKMDTIGIAFENYDGVGARRELDGRQPIDASGTLPDGRAFADLAGLRSILLEHYRDDFCRCLTEKMFTFALGRGLEYTDTDEVERIAKKLAENDYRFSTLVLEIVKSDLFRKRRGERLTP